MLDLHGLTADDIATKAMKIAADLCVYSNHNTIREVLVKSDEKVPSKIIVQGQVPKSIDHLFKFLNLDCST